MTYTHYEAMIHSSLRLTGYLLCCGLFAAGVLGLLCGLCLVRAKRDGAGGEAA